MDAKNCIISNKVTRHLINGLWSAGNLYDNPIYSSALKKISAMIDDYIFNFKYTAKFLIKL